MPIKYALRSMRTTPLTDVERSEYIALGYSPIELFYSYKEVSPTIAESDEDNGVYAIFSYKRRKLSSWVSVNKNESLVIELRKSKKPGSFLKDSIKQDIGQGDYAFAHDRTHKQLKLVQVVRVMRSRVVIESLGEDWIENEAVRTMNPSALIKIPSTLIHDDVVVADEKWEKRFAVRTEVQDRFGTRIEYVEVDEVTALKELKGQFGYFNANGDSVSGWIPVLAAAYDNLTDSWKESLDSRLTDVIGTDIRLSDWVFSNDNRSHNFKLCRVIGFSNDLVRLNNFTQGEKNTSLNYPKNIVKLPIQIP